MMYTFVPPSSFIANLLHDSGYVDNTRLYLLILMIFFNLNIVLNLNIYLNIYLNVITMMIDLLI